MIEPERPAWMDDPSSWPGMRVAVFLVADQTQHLGTISAVMKWTLNGRALTGACPEITLDDGRTIHGYECFWTEAGAE